MRRVCYARWLTDGAYCDTSSDWIINVISPTCAFPVITCQNAIKKKAYIKCLLISASKIRIFISFHDTRNLKALVFFNLIDKLKKIISGLIDNENTHLQANY